jgi:hypothetical protein
MARQTQPDRHLCVYRHKDVLASAAALNLRDMEVLTPSSHQLQIGVNMAEYVSQRQRLSLRTKLSKYLLKFSKYLLTSARAGVSGAAKGGSEGVMPERANSLAYASFAGALVAAAILGLDTTPSAGADCLENPDLRITQPGHWYFHSDRTQNRKCWYFQPAEVAAPAATADAPASQPVAAGRDDLQQSLLSRFATELAQSFHSQPQQREAQQNSIPANSVEATQTVSPRPAKPDRAARWERPRVAPPPTTTGAASAEKGDQPQRPAADSPPNVAEREALFQDFVKWQMERDVFGQ